MHYLIGNKILVSGCVLTLAVLKIGSASADSGQELYESNCAACHGDDGTPLLPGTPVFSKGERLDKSDEQLMKSISHGINVMPPWDGILNRREMKDCLEHLKALAEPS